jgi:hypothetical protein
MIDSIWKEKFAAAEKQPQRLAARSDTRQQRWRRLHPEKYRERQAAYMKRWRAAAKKGEA